MPVFTTGGFTFLSCGCVNESRNQPALTTSTSTRRDVAINSESAPTGVEFTTSPLHPSECDYETYSVTDVEIFETVSSSPKASSDLTSKQLILTGTRIARDNNHHEIYM